MAYALTVCDYVSLLERASEKRDIKSLAEIYDGMMSGVLGMNKTYSCVAGKVTPHAVIIHGKETPACICARYQTPDKRRGAAVIIAFDRTPEEEIDRHFQKMKQNQIAAATQAFKMTMGKVTSDIEERIKLQAEVQITAHRKTYVPSLHSHALYTGTWVHDMEGIDMVVPGADDDALGKAASCVGCKESIADLEKGFIFLPEDHRMFVIRTLFEEQRNGSQA